MAADETRLEADRRKALGLAISQIEKQLGKGSIMRMGADSPRVKVAAIPTGAINLDAATGVGGIPRGRITEIYGPESSGKTTLTLHLAANVQKMGGVAAYVDAEHALDIEYAKKLGVDIENLLVSQPDTGEQALEIVEILVRSGAVDIVVIDSVAALVPKAEIEGEMGESHMGLQARLMSQALRKLAGSINRSNCAVVFINQLREKIGVMFGNPETTTGGKALKFYASLRLDIRRIGPVKERETVIGNHVRVKVVKNKVAPPFRQAEFDVMFDEGISHTSLLVDLAAEAGIIQKSGAWYSYGDQRIGQGRENAKLFLRDNPVLMTEVEGKGQGAPRHADSCRGRGRGRSGRIAGGRRASTITALEPDPAPPGRGSAGDRWRPLRRGSPRARERRGTGGGRLVDRRELAAAAGRRGRHRGGLPHGAALPGAPLLCPERSGPPAVSGRATRGTAVEAALERATGLGLLDDAAYARNYVQTRAARGRGPSRLIRDLLAMGVQRSLIDRRSGRRVARGKRSHPRCRWRLPPSARPSLAPSRARPSGGGCLPIWPGGASPAGR